MAHLLTHSVKMAHFGQTAAFCVVCVCTCMHVCVYVCVWLSAKMAHLLTCSVKMAHLWTDSHILCYLIGASLGELHAYGTAVQNPPDIYIYI